MTEDAQIKPLTKCEIQMLRDIVKSQERLQWLGKWARNIAIWVAGLVTAWIAFGQALRKLLGLDG